MAKKKSVGTGKKRCPSCDKIIPSASRECPKCKHKFVARKKKRRKKAVEAPAAPTPQAPEVDVATVVKAHDLIQRCGGVGKAKGMLDTVARAAKQ